MTAFCGKEKIISEEIRESVQIIEVVYDEIEIAMKVGQWCYRCYAKTIDFLKEMLDYGSRLARLT